jgi:hypothetical protein
MQRFRKECDRLGAYLFKDEFSLILFYVFLLLFK